MARATKLLRPNTSERKTLLRRIRRMYDSLNRGLWEKCFSLIDPQLRNESRVDYSIYAAQLQTFRDVYGEIRPWHIRVSLHTGEQKRPFAYVYLVWQDRANEFHMFRERWVKDAGRWYTRVLGLVPNRHVES